MSEHVFDKWLIRVAIIRVPPAACALCCASTVSSGHPRVSFSRLTRGLSTPGSGYQPDHMPFLQSGGLQEQCGAAQCRLQPSETSVIKAQHQVLPKAARWSPVTHPRATALLKLPSVLKQQPHRLLQCVYVHIVILIPAQAAQSPSYTLMVGPGHAVPAALYAAGPCLQGGASSNVSPFV